MADLFASTDEQEVEAFKIEQPVGSDQNLNVDLLTGNHGHGDGLSGESKNHIDLEPFATADSTTNTNSYNHDFQFSEIPPMETIPNEVELPFEDINVPEQEEAEGDSDADSDAQTPVVVTTAQDLLLDFGNENQDGNLLARRNSDELKEDKTPTAEESNTSDDNTSPNLFGSKEATPPPSPPPSPKSEPISTVTTGMEQKPYEIADQFEPPSVASSGISGLVADSTTSPASDDRPVRMPKATTIAPPTKTAPSRCTNSNSTGCILSWLKQLDPRVWDLLLWRDPRITGVVLAAVMLVLFSLACCSVFSVVSYLLILCVMASFGTRMVKYVIVKIHKGENIHPFKDLLEADIAISEDMVQDYTQAAVQKLNAFSSNLRDLVFVREFIPSLKLGLVLYAMTYIGACFNGMTVLILVTAAVFTLPKVYEVNKSQIDRYVDMAMSKFDDYYRKLQDKVPYLKKQKVQ